MIKLRTFRWWSEANSTAGKRWIRKILIFNLLVLTPSCMNVSGKIRQGYSSLERKDHWNEHAVPDIFQSVQSCTKVKIISPVPCATGEFILQMGHWVRVSVLSFVCGNDCWSIRSWECTDAYSCRLSWYQYSIVIIKIKNNLQDRDEVIWRLAVLKIAGKIRAVTSTTACCQHRG